MSECAIPLQYADNSKDIVTHFDFSYFENFVEQVSFPATDQDRLRKLEHLTKTKASDIPINDLDIYSLFTITDELAVFKEGFKMMKGTLSMAEFSDDLIDDIMYLCKPKNFEDLVKICGLYCSPDSWFYNVREHICNGTAELKELPAVREDIMEYLVSKGVEPAAADEIMKITMFGTAKTKLLPEHVKTMSEHGVPW